MTIGEKIMKAAMDPLVQIDVDNFVDNQGVRFIGKAAAQEDGTWRALADVGGALCLVELSFVFPEQDPTAPQV